MCSHYFKSTSETIYNTARDAFTSRPQAHFCSLRNHAKLLAIQLDDGRSVTVESSANLRSNKNIESMSFFG